MFVNLIWSLISTKLVENADELNWSLIFLKVYSVVDEMFLAGEIRETSQIKVLKQLTTLTSLE